MAEKSSFLVSGVAWIGTSDVSVIGDNEGVVPHVLNIVLNVRASKVLGNWRQHLGSQMRVVVLLLHQGLNLGSNLFTDLDGLLVSQLWVEGTVPHCVNELGSLCTFQNPWVRNVLI